MTTLYDSFRCPSKTISYNYDTHRMERIDDSVLLAILELLQPEDLLVCAHVCQRWRACVCDDLVWKRHCNLKGARTLSEDFKELFLKQQKEKYRVKVAKLKKLKKFSSLGDMKNSVFKHFQLVSYVEVRTNDKGWNSKKVYRLDSDDTNIFSHSVCYRWWNELSLLELDMAKVQDITLYLGVPLVFSANKAAPQEASHWCKRLVVTPSEAVRVAGDSLVEVYNLGCVSYALWKDTHNLAFLTATFHQYRELVEDVITYAAHTGPVAATLPTDGNIDCYVSVRNYRKELLQCAFSNLYFESDGNGHKLCGISEDLCETINDKVELLWRTTNFKNKLPMTCVCDVSLVHSRSHRLLATLSQVTQLVPAVPDVTDYSMFSDEVFRLSVSDAGLSCDMVFVRTDEGYSLHSLNVRII